MLKNLGELEEARDFSEQAYKTFLNKFGPGHPHTIIREKESGVYLKINCLVIELFPTLNCIKYNPGFKWPRFNSCISILALNL